MKGRKGLKRRLQQCLSGFLATAVTVGSIQFPPVNAAVKDATVLPTVHTDLGEIDENYSWFSFGTVQSEVEEKGKYALTIYRDGNIDAEATVDLMTVDISAKYGEDYIVVDNASSTDEHETDATMVELISDEENQQMAEETIEEINNAIQSSVEEEEGTEAKEAEVEEIEEEEAEEEKTEATSPLAQLKEQQTGLPTRETYDAEGLPLEDIIIQNIQIDVGQEVATSSATHLVFAPGEVEKHVVFEVLEDEESEGQELVNFLLSAPDSQSTLSDYFSLGITIEDDEPVEHSVVSFSEAEYDADEEQVVVKVVREKALYSYVTVRIHSNETGDAKTGVNFTGVDQLLEFAPHQEEVEITIPVRAEGDMSFELALSEFKGGVEGEFTKAKVLLYGEKDSTPMLMSLNARSGESGENPKILIDGREYELEVDEESSVWRILDLSTNPKSHVGDYYLPIGIDEKNKVEGLAGNVEYGFSKGDSGREKNEYNKDGEYGHLVWWSWWAGNKGAEVAKYKVDISKYQYIALDYATLSEYESSKCGMDITIKNNALNLSRDLKFSVTREMSRQISEHLVLYGTDDKVTWTPDTVGENTEISIYAERTAGYLVEPEIQFWGLVGMFKEYDITLEQPDKMKYRDGDVIVEKSPARAVLPAGHDKKFLGEDFSIQYSSIEEGGTINGKLVGYDVKFGDDSEYHRFETTDTTLSFSGDFLEFVETYGPQNIEVKKKSSIDHSYITKLTVKPVFEYKNVRVEINNSEYGTFDDANLKKTTTDVFHVGDKIKISATAYNKYKDYEYEAYESEAYVNPGDTKPEESGVIPGDYELEFKKVKYALTPVFTQQKNIIEIQLDKEAEKYFTVENIVPKEQLTYTDMKGKNVLYIEAPLDGETHTRPVYGKVYEITLKPTEENDGTYRPVITQNHTGQSVNGYCMYVLAYEKASKNVIKVSAEQCNPEDYQLFSLEGYAKYASVTLRQSVASLYNQPATNVVATTATINEKLYNASGKLEWMLQNRAGTNKIDTETNSQVEGSYVINGIPAIPGDTISVKLTNNDVEQVQYVKLTATGMVQEKRTYDVIVANEETNTNDVVSKEEVCTIVESEPVDMPVRTPYSPYVSDITYSYLKTNVDPSINSIPIIYADSPDVLTITADVEFNGHNPENLDVYFTLKNKEGLEIVEEKALYNEDTKKYFIDFNPSAHASDGDMVYVKIVSNGIEYTSLNTGLNFYTQAQTINNLKMDIQTSQFAQGAPIFENLNGMINSGKMYFGEAQYEDPNNKGRSAYTRVFAVSGEINAKGIQKFDELKNGKHEDAQAAQPSKQEAIDDAVNAITDNIVKKKYEDDGGTNYAGLSQADKDKLMDQYKAQEKKNAAKEYNKSSLAKISKKIDVKCKVSALVRLEYLYRPTTNEHIYAGSQYAFGVFLDVEKTQYWLLGSVPIYLNIQGGVSVQIDGATTTEDAIITEKELNDYENMADMPVRYSNPWFNFGLSLKLQPGVGYYGVASIRGIFEVNALFRVNMSSGSAGDPMKSGLRFELAGGVGVDLFLITLNFQVGIYRVEAGVFDPNTYQPSATSYSLRNNSDIYATQTEISLENYEVVEEENSLMGKRTMLRSSLEPVSKKNLIEGTLEYVRPSMTTLPDGRVFMVYLQKGSDRNDANASQLVYSIRDTVGAWSKPVVIDKGNQTTETSPSILAVGDKVYIAWSYANKAVSGSNELEPIKADLQSLDIKMSVFNATNNTLSSVKTVSTDNFMDKYVQMTLEGENIVLYYLKDDLSLVDEEQDLLSPSSNYNTWAKVIYSPSEDTFVEQTVYSGTTTEKLMNILHSSIHDPLVLDYSVGSVEHGGNTYSFSAYSVDSDKNIETDDDKELWLEMRVGDKTYYPIQIETGSGYVTSLKLTQLKDDVFMTWVSEAGVFNSVSLKSLLKNLDYEGSLAYILATDGTEFDWCEELIGSKSLDENAHRILYNLAKGKVSIVTADFGVVDSVIEEDRSIAEYKIVQGADNSIYLFWTEGTSDSDELGKELFATTYYVLDDDWKNKWQSNMPETGWGKPVQLTHYGKELQENLVLDEVEVVIQEDKGAVVIANTYNIDINDETGAVEYSKHNLTEIVCRPTSSLKIVDDEITLSEDYPLPGEEINVSFDIKNDGLLPSEGSKVALVVLKDGKELARKEVTETDPTDTIYVGNTFRYSTSLKIPEKLTYPFELRVDVQELQKESDGEYKAIGATDSAERTIDYRSQVMLGEVEDYNLVELEQLMEEKEPGDVMYDAYQDAVSKLKQGEEYTHAYFIPVENSGNEASEKMEIQVQYVDGEFEVGEKLGQSEKFTVNLRETKYVCVLVNAKPEQFREVSGEPLGMLDTKLAVMVDGKEVEAYASHHTIYEIEDIGFIVNEGQTEVTLGKNAEHQLTIKGYPFNMEDKEFYFESTDDSIATVNSEGQITALKSGKTTIEITDLKTGQKEVIKLTVKGKNTGAEEGENGNGSNGGTATDEGNKSDSVNTGDQTKLGLVMLMVLASGSVCFVLLRKRKKGSNGR